MFSFLDCSFFERGEGREGKRILLICEGKIKRVWMKCEPAVPSDISSCCFCSACIFQVCWDCFPDDICQFFLDRSSFSSSLAHLLFRKSTCTCSFSSGLSDEWQWHVEKLALLEPSVAFQHLLIFVSLSPRIFLAPANSGLTLMVCDHLAPACWGCLSPARWSIQSRILIRHSSESEQAYA